MKPNNTLLILTPGFPADEQDTSCLPSQQLLIKAIKRNFPSLKILIVTLQYPFVATEYEWDGIKVISFNNKTDKKSKRIVSWLKIWKELRKQNIENNITGIFSFWCTECAFIGKRFGQYYSIPHYNWILGQDAREDNKYIPLIRPKAGELVAISEFVAEEFYRNYGIKPAYVIPNGIDATLFSGGPPQRDIDILCAGSLISLKQHDIFIDIVKVLTTITPGISALICGKGPEEKRLKKKTEELRLNDNLSFSGELEHTALLKTMQRSKILLHPSSYEGFSTVCLEALYAGAHVISFCKPMNESLPHWYIVKTKEEMIKKTLELLKNQSIEYRPICKYTMDDNAKAVMKLFGQ